MKNDGRESDSGMQKLKMDRITLTVLCIFFLSIMIPASVIYSVSFYEYVQTQDSIYTGVKERQAASVEKAISDQLAHINDMSVHYIYSRWLSRLNNHIGLYQDEFDLPKRIEIKDDLAAQKDALGFVADILILVPQKELFISSMGWFDIASFDDYYNNEYLKLVYEEGVIQSSSDNIIPITTGSAAFSENTVCVLIDIDRMRRYVEAATLYQFLDFEITWGDRQVVNWQEFDSTSQKEIIAGSILPLGFNLNIAYSPYQMVTDIDNYAIKAITLVLIIIIALLISLMLAKIMTKPVRGIINKVMNQNNETVARHNYLAQISDYVDSILSSNEQLAIFEKHMRDLAFFQLLTDRFSSIAPDEYILELIPWWKQKIPFVILLMVRKTESNQTDVSEMTQLISQSCSHLHKLNIPNCDLTFLIWSYDATPIKETLIGAYGDQWHIAFSDLYPDMQLISTAYIQVRTRLDLQLEIDGTQFASEQLPISAELQLLNALQEGRFGESEKIITTLIRKNKDTVNNIVRLLVRLSLENYINCKEHINHFNELMYCQDSKQMLDSLLRFCNEICESVRQIRTRNSSDLAMHIQEFISSNYNECDLSLKMLSDKFHISTTLLSKIFKAEFGINFADYLLTIRLKHAKHMLQNTTLPIADISNSVGYQNYLSFKRAFIRSENISPREYRDQMRLQSETR